MKAQSTPLLVRLVEAWAIAVILVPAVLAKFLPF
jgi:hypothetical protein